MRVVAEIHEAEGRWYWAIHEADVKKPFEDKWKRTHYGYARSEAEARDMLCKAFPTAQRAALTGEQP